MKSQIFKSVIEKMACITEVEIKKLEKEYQKKKDARFAKYLLTLLVLVTTTACAGSQSNSVYVSPDHYSDYNCNQIQAEKKRIGAKLEQMTEVKTKDGESNVAGEVLGAAIVGYAISQGYGFRGNQKSDVPFRRLQNQYDVLEQTAIEKECF